MDKTPPLLLRKMHDFMKGPGPRLFHSLKETLPHERRCLACAKIHCPPRERQKAPGALFCPDCRTELPQREKGHCPVCGELAAWPDLQLATCLRCLERRPIWDAFFFYAPYQGKIRQLLLALKFKEQILLGHALGCLLAEHPALHQLQADAIVPVPLHQTRLAQRGYNQALEIARPLAAKLRIPLRHNMLIRTRNTAPQSSYRLEQRKKNILGAFICDQDVKGQRLLLVDDTFTTGATITAAGNVLLEAGAVWLGVAVVGRTAKHAPALS